MIKNLFKTIVSSALHGILSRFDNLYMKHKGEECYIFGDGVTLKWMDLKKFNDRPAIMGNYLMFHKDIEAVNPLYYVLIEPFYFYPFFLYHLDGKRKVMKHTLGSVCKKRMSELGKGRNITYFVNASNILSTFYLKNLIYVFRFFRSGHKISNPFSKRGDCYNGTLKFQLSLAMFMGFKKVYLVGHDYTHNPSRSLHFYEKGEGKLGVVKGFCNDFFKFIEDDNELDFEIVTVTVDSEGEYLNAITYEELTGDKPEYKENTEIISRDNLEKLATWDGYSIF